MVVVVVMIVALYLVMIPLMADVATWGYGAVPPLKRPLSGVAGILWPLWFFVFGLYAVGCMFVDFFSEHFSADLGHDLRHLTCQVRGHDWRMWNGPDNMECRRCGMRKTL